MSSLPTPRTLLSSLLPPLPLSPPPLPSHPPQPTSPPTPLNQTHKPLFLTLHCLFPNELLPALDLLDRRQVTRFILQDRQPSYTHTHRDESIPPEQLEHPSRFPTSTSNSLPEAGPQLPPAPSNKANNKESIYYVRSSTTTHHQPRFKSSSSTSSSRYARASASTTLEADTRHYEVRLQAWNCTCAAFAFAAFVGEGGALPTLQVTDPQGWGAVRGAHGEGGGEGEGDVRRGNAGRERRRGWEFGGVTLGEDVPVCKHLLACVLAERVEGLEAFVEEKVVEREELAGWAAGWGG